MNSAPTYYCRFPSGEIRGPVNGCTIQEEIDAGVFPADFMVSRDAKDPWVLYSELLEKGDQILPEVKAMSTPPRPTISTEDHPKPILAQFFGWATGLAFLVGIVFITSGVALGRAALAITGLSLIFGAAPVLCWMGSVITLLDRIARNGEGK